MKSVEIRNSCLFYYGNPVGFMENDCVAVDPQFQREDLEGWLTRQGIAIRWVEGIYDRLISGGYHRVLESGSPLKACRIWQMGADTPIEMRFISLERMEREYGGPDPARYHVAFDGQVESDELEDIWNRFSCKALSNGDHPLAISDVIELYDDSGSAFFYVDRTQIVPIPFERREQVQEITL